jgi:hypothetical protein
MDKTNFNAKAEELLKNAEKTLKGKALIILLTWI